MSAPAPPPLSHAHHTAPPHIRAIHKTYQKLSLPALSHDPHILDLAASADTPAREWHARHVKIVGHVPAERAIRAFKAFRAAAGEEAAGSEEEEGEGEGVVGDAAIYEHDFVPGLQIIPSLLPPATQRALLSALLHRHLSNPAHATNLHPHYTLPYPPPASSSSSSSPTTTTTTSSSPDDDDTAAAAAASFFTLPPATPLPPRDPATHNPLTAQRMLAKKLRWLTLGAQYDWTLKQYPAGSELAFPRDVAGLITDLLPETTAPQAAITNLYSPGDMLAPHRDVSEASRAPLVSVSVGCDAVFVVGLDAASPASPTSCHPGAEATPQVLVLRVRSGDVVLMGGASRWAWHSVPRVVAGSCPGGIAEWPGMEGWEGWMGGKRVNLNVRQMWD
ncbi:uncharacterized protein H6S33_000392 [Morchella sextelata]|uniref:uncharacterized protein n=1 Tax=Morchella sextelata TaxID=1174677 RepID=UPI001D0411BA|nr:uncharacterized protein H6S33_000392 [Morchella sextelata]KAH0614756.1 hypothetical protein H6S33_000392 [Morchella sextelata]